MEPGAWLVLPALNWGQPVTMAWPAPDLFTCEEARSVIAPPTHHKTYCTLEKPKADYFGPPLPLASNPTSGFHLKRGSYWLEVLCIELLDTSLAWRTRRGAWIMEFGVWAARSAGLTRSFCVGASRRAYLPAKEQLVLNSPGLQKFGRLEPRGRGSSERMSQLERERHIQIQRKRFHRSVFALMVILTPPVPWLPVLAWNAGGGAGVAIIAVALAIMIGLRASVVVRPSRVVITRKWFFIPYWRYSGRVIENVWYGGDWGEREGASGVCVQLNGKEIHIGSRRTMDYLDFSLPIGR